MISNPPVPALSDRLADAFAVVLNLHRDQTRKVRPIPYIAHLMSVAALVLEDGGSEDEAIAALLHDAIEDQGGVPTRAKLLQRFGPQVIAIVDVCTEPPRQPDQSWRDHKLAYLRQVAQAPEVAQRVVLADKLHNVRSLLENLALQGDVIWSRFAATPEDYLWLYRSLTDLFDRALPGHLTTQLKAAVTQLSQRVQPAQNSGPVRLDTICLKTARSDKNC
ncbi:HD domain-containing protein [Nodosilinea nodulosa]|uniref:HD domain-containing protein n=1 Tax=Nodosilinea nodulosa TaxID=416001 RepID=UPI000311BF20|nr:HD domain-containing protein [Nodosilinea nodulosa]